MVLVQNWPFFHLFVLGNIGQENVFYDILERKNAFLGYKRNIYRGASSAYPSSLITTSSFVMVKFIFK